MACVRVTQGAPTLREAAAIGLLLTGRLARARPAPRPEQLQRAGRHPAA